MMTDQKPITSVPSILLTPYYFVSEDPRIEGVEGCVHCTLHLSVLD